MADHLAGMQLGETGQDERQSPGIVDSTAVGGWLLQSHISSYLLRETHTAERRHVGREWGWRERYTHTEKREC